MVSLSEPLSYEEITSHLSKDDKIGLICCNCCVRFCGTGGVDIMNDLADRLRADGYIVTDIVPTACLCVHDYVRNARISDGITKMIVSACVAGWTSTARWFKDTEVEVVPTVKSLGLVIGDMRVGRFKLMMPFEEYKDLQGKEWNMMAGATHADDSKIDVPVPEGH